MLHVEQRLFLTLPKKKIPNEYSEARAINLLCFKRARRAYASEMKNVKAKI